jgi:hypothetical protein
MQFGCSFACGSSRIAYKKPVSIICRLQTADRTGYKMQTGGIKGAIDKTRIVKRIVRIVRIADE